MRALGREHLPIAEKKRPRHLQTIPRKVANTTTPEKRDRTAPPNTRTEQFKKAAFAKTKRTIKLAPWIRDARHVTVVTKILSLLAGLEHVHQH